MARKIYAPNVHLFAFHLKDRDTPNLLWDKCNHILSQRFGITKPLEIEEQPGYRVDLLKDKTLVTAFYQPSTRTRLALAERVSGGWVLSRLEESPTTPDITAKVARLRCRIFEVGVSYSGRTYEEGKKIGWKDGFRAIWCILKYNLWSRK